MFDRSITRLCVNIPVLEDQILEEDETFNVNLDGSGDVNLDPSEGTVTITDTTGKAFLLFFFLKQIWISVFLSVIRPEFELPDYSVPENGGELEVCVTVPAGQIERDIILQLVEQSGTATSECSVLQKDR